MQRNPLKPSFKEVTGMAKYLIQAAYTSEAWKNLIASPQNRMEAIRPVW